jgi:peptidoglycan/xylan/chitin deacetylase (PgdA/CDA1 family)
VAMLFSRERRHFVLHYMAPLLLALCGLATYNWYLFGAPWRLPGTMQLSTGAVPGYFHNPFQGLMQLLVGSGGLLTVTPLLGLAVPGWLRMWRSNRQQALTVSLPVLMTALILASHTGVQGDVTADARKAILVLPLVAPLLSLGLDWALPLLPGVGLWIACGLLLVYSLAYAALLRLRLAVLASAPADAVDTWGSVAILLGICILSVATVLLFRRLPRVRIALVSSLVAGGTVLLLATTLLPLAMVRAEAELPTSAENLLGNGNFSLREDGSGNLVGWKILGKVQIKEGQGVELATGATLVSPLVEVRSTNALVGEVVLKGGPIELTYQWEGLDHRVLESDVYLLEPSSRPRVSASAPPRATGVRLQLRALGPTSLAGVKLWEAGVRLEPFPDYYRAALAFSFDWETAMGGAIHSRGDANHDVAGAVGAGLKMREGARWLGDLLAQRGISATFFATGYNLLFGNQEGRQFVGNPTYKWANRKNGWASDYWTSHPWYSDDPRGDYLTDPAWYFGDLTLYLKGRGHDIQTHTFGHLYVRGTKPQELDMDLKEWNRVASEIGLNSAVTFSFPWTSSNSIGADHYRVLVQNGIKYVTRTYDHPHPFELRSIPDAPGLVFLPDQQLEPSPSSLARGLSAMEEAVTRRGYLSLWSHPEDAADAYGRQVWEAAVERAADLRDRGELWVQNVTTLLDYNRALKAVSIETWRWGNTWSMTITYQGDKPLRGVTLALPGVISSAQVDGQSWSDYRESRLRLPELTPESRIRVVASLR